MVLKSDHHATINSKVIAHAECKILAQTNNNYMFFHVTPLLSLCPIVLYITHPFTGIILFDLITFES